MLRFSFCDFVRWAREFFARNFAEESKAMSNRASRRSRRKKRKDDFSELTRKRSIVFPIFVTTLLVLLAGSAFWAATRDRSSPIAVDTADGGKRTISAIGDSKSFQQLEDAGKEVELRITGKQPQEVQIGRAHV